MRQTKAYPEQQCHKYVRNNNEFVAWLGGK